MDINTFSTKEYNSDYGFLTSIWGPAMWFSLHIISFNYPVNPTENDKEHYYDFIMNLKNILPCKMCRKNLSKNLKKHKHTKQVFTNRTTFSKWIYELHEVVNKMLGKKSNLSYEQVRCFYENFRAHCVEDKNKKIESGCKEPLYGIYSQTLLNIIPQNVKHNSSILIDKKCLLSKSPCKNSPKKSTRRKK